MESKSESQISEGPPRKPIVWRWTEQGYLPFIDVPYMPRKDFKAPSVDDVELMYNYLVDNKTKLAEIKKVAEDEKI
jgi:hypothetical protein